MNARISDFGDADWTELRYEALTLSLGGIALSNGAFTPHLIVATPPKWRPRFASKTFYVWHNGTRQNLGVSLEAETIVTVATDLLAIEVHLGFSDHGGGTWDAWLIRLKDQSIFWSFDASFDERPRIQSIFERIWGLAPVFDRSSLLDGIQREFHTLPEVPRIDLSALRDIPAPLVACIHELRAELSRLRQPGVGLYSADIDTISAYLQKLIGVRTDPEFDAQRAELEPLIAPLIERAMKVLEYEALVRAPR